MAKLSPVKVKKEPDEPSTVVKVKQKAASKTKKSKFPCDQCKKILSSAAHLKKHNNTTHRLRDYVCDYDGKHFNTKDKLRLHIYIHRKHFRVHCEVCSKEYTTNQSMRKHLRTHFEHHQCDACGKTFKHKRLLLNHVSAIHSDDPTISCKYCTRLFPNTTTRDAHQKSIHQDKQVNTGFFLCSDCPLGFEMKEELRIHSFIHYNGIIHTCLECHQIFKKKKLLNNHMRKHEKPSFQCSTCLQLFTYRSSLGKHIRGGRCKGFVQEVVKVETSAETEAELAKQQLIAMTVNPTRVTISNIKDYDIGKVKKEETFKSFTFTEFVEDLFAENPFDDSDLNAEDKQETFEPSKRVYRKKKPARATKTSASALYKCDLCDFTTAKKNYLLSHIRLHVSSSRHKCKNCSETFSTRMNLHNHSMKAHGRGVIGSVEYSKMPSECPVCHRMFSEERLRLHMKLHDSPSFTCDKCSKKFRSQSALKKHLETNHVSPKIFYCSNCGKGFKKMTILKQHEEVHNPVKLYVQCEICNTMMQVKSLKLHMEMQHSDRYKVKNFVCECGKAFRYEKQLQKHVNSVHDKVNLGIVYPCPDCHIVFNRRQDLRDHSFDHFTGKVFLCHCGMKFKTKKLLRIHDIVHSDKKNLFACIMCTMTFQTRGGLRKHRINIHKHTNDDYVEIPAYETIASC